MPRKAPPRREAAKARSNAQPTIPVASWRQVHRQEPAAAKGLPQKRPGSAESDAWQEAKLNDPPPPEFPSWIKNARSRPSTDTRAAKVAADEPDRATADDSETPASTTATTTTSSVPTPNKLKRARSTDDGQTNTQDGGGLVLPVAKSSAPAKAVSSKLQRSRELVAMARQQRRELVEKTAGAERPYADQVGESALPDAVAFLQSEHGRGVAKGLSAGADVLGGDSAVPAAEAFLESERRLTQVERAKALTKALLSKKKPPKVPTLQPGAVTPHAMADARHRAVQSAIASSVIATSLPGPDATSAADLRVAVPMSPHDKLELPLRYHRLMQQFGCLDTALSFLKTRRQTGARFL